MLSIDVRLQPIPSLTQRHRQQAGSYPVAGLSQVSAHRKIVGAAKERRCGPRSDDCGVSGDRFVAAAPQSPASRRIPSCGSVASFQRTAKLWEPPRNAGAGRDRTITVCQATDSLPLHCNRQQAGSCRSRPVCTRCLLHAAQRRRSGGISYTLSRSTNAAKVINKTGTVSTRPTRK